MKVKISHLLSLLCSLFVFSSMQAQVMTRAAYAEFAKGHKEVTLLKANTNKDHIKSMKALVFKFAKIDRVVVMIEPSITNREDRGDLVINYAKTIVVKNIFKGTVKFITCRCPGESNDDCAITYNSEEKKQECTGGACCEKVEFVMAGGTIVEWID